MFEKVNPAHPDKIADRIAGAIVDNAYSRENNPRVAVEVLVGHGVCNVIIESNLAFPEFIVEPIVRRIAGDVTLHLVVVPQDRHLSGNQDGKLRCGDNGIFKGVPTNEEEMKLACIADDLYEKYGTDGKYILDNGKLIICQSNASTLDLRRDYPDAIVNPLGFWTGGSDVDSGATNRKLGSDMGRAVTGGGISGKDLSKADVSVNIYAYLRAQEENREVNICCAIGDEYVDGHPYSEIVDIARGFIAEKGGFEKFAEWGLI